MESHHSSNSQRTCSYPRDALGFKSMRTAEEAVKKNWAETKKKKKNRKSFDTKVSDFFNFCSRIHLEKEHLKKT